MLFRSVITRMFRQITKENCRRPSNKPISVAIEGGDKSFQLYVSFLLISIQVTDACSTEQGQPVGSERLKRTPAKPFRALGNLG
ncbi:hypothetical protein V6N13_118291 [Hibiscus sabdariffa]|uniref:Uncharacterized protein n=1 Tax=Hibiscus sabdariffa TaxID=183260 RepID=A0ABR2Q868_9ROSI